MLVVVVVVVVIIIIITIVILLIMIQFVVDALPGRLHLLFMLLVLL